MAASFTLPTVLANLTAGNEPLSLIDGDFTALYNPSVSLNTYNNFYTDVGAANAYAITVSSPQTVTQTAGLQVSFIAAHVNTGASTFQINALAVKNILRPDGTNLLAGDIPANGIVTVIYDGTQYQLQSSNNALFTNQSANTVFAGPSSGAAAAPAFRALVGADGATWVYLGTKVASGASSVTGGTVAANASDIKFDWTSYHEYQFDLVDFTFSNQTTLQINISLDGGSTFRSSAADYEYVFLGMNSSASANNVTNSGNTAMVLTATVNNTANRNALQGTISVKNPSKTGQFKSIEVGISYEDTTPRLETAHGHGAFIGTTGAMTGIKFSPGAGTFSGTVYVFGKRNS